MQDYVFEPRGIAYRTNRFEPGRQTLVFIHGLSSSASAWLLYEERFWRRYNVLTFDLHGHGKSSKSKGGARYTIPALADDLHALAALLGIEPFVLIGHSFGTLVALEYLVRHPHSVSKAVLLSPEFKVGRRLPEQVLGAVLRLSPILDVFPFSSRPAGHVDYAPFVNTGDWNLRRLFADIRNTGVRVYFYCVRESSRFDREHALSAISLPVLLIHGKKDTIFPMTNALQMAAQIPGSQLLLLDQASHVVVLNNFTELSEAIEGFVGDKADMKGR